jgi:DNA-binding CsgD family transcriptional regulator
MKRGFDWDAELAKAVQAGESSSELAARLGVAQPTAWIAANRRNIRLRAATTKRAVAAAARDETIARVVASTNSLSATGRLLGISPQRVNQIMRRWRSKQSAGA